MLNKRFGIIIFQLRFDTVKVNWIKTNAYKGVLAFTLPLWRIRGFLRYATTSRMSLFIGSLQRRQKESEVCILPLLVIVCIMQTEIVFASHTQFRSLLVFLDFFAFILPHLQSSRDLPFESA